jgi:hypothetical protein
MFQDSHEWTLWKARDALGERQPHEQVCQVIRAEPQAKPLTKRKRHWAGPFQEKFSHWLKGDGERPCDLGYTRRQLMRHLERQLSKGMSWDNYAGNRPFRAVDVWVVDHIVPKRLFDADDVIHAYTLTNLRPLWLSDNMSKGMLRTHLI